MASYTQAAFDKVWRWTVRRNGRGLMQSPLPSYKVCTEAVAGSPTEAFLVKKLWHSLPTFVSQQISHNPAGFHRVLQAAACLEN